MFDFNKFLMDAFMDGVEQGESRYRLGMRMVPFYQGGALSDDNMVAIDAALTERDKPEPEPEVDPNMMADTTEVK